MSKKPVNFGVMLGNALLSTGKAEWDTDKDNNIVLSEEDKTKITADWGADFLAKLTPLLNSDTEPTEQQTAELHTALVAHLQAEFDKKMEAEKKAATEKIEAKQAEIAKLQKEKLELAKENALLSGKTEELPDAQAATDFFPARAKRKKGDTVMAVNMKAAHYASVQRAAQSGIPLMAQGNIDIDVTDLRNEFGVYLSQGNNLDLYTDIMAEFTTGAEMTPVMAIAEYRAVQGLTTSVLQQFTPQWTGYNKTKFKPLVIKNRRLKVNARITPAEVLDSYMLALYDERLAPDQMPLTQYILEKIIKPAILDDLEMRCVAKGRYVEPEYDENGVQITGTLPEDSMDGFETILAGNLNNAESGINYFPNAKTWDEIKALTAEEGLQWISEFSAFVAPNMKKKIANVYCSPEFYTFYSAWYKEYWAKGSGVNDPEFGMRRIDFTKFTLKALDSMYGSPILFATPKENFVMLRYRNEVPNIINDVQKQDYTVKFFGEFWFAPGFAIANAVFASVPAGYDPKASINENFNAADRYKGYKAAANGIVNLKSAAGTTAQNVDVAEAIAPISYKTKGGDTTIAWTGTANAGTAPEGIVAVIADDTVTIAGTPTAAGNYGYTVTVAGVKEGTAATSTGTITVVSGV